jgi:hypothetical protein
MADFTGIQAVTATLRALLIDRMEQAATVTVRTSPLDVDGSDEAPYVNIFLYRIAENAELKNQDLPGMVAPLALGHPPLSLDLYYLITAAGADVDDDRAAQRVLGDAMLVLHDHSVIPKDDPVLDPTLQNEVELLKITMEPLDIEELSKIWTASTGALRLSAAYKVTVVQLESSLPRRVPKPVLEPPTAGPRVYAEPIDRPQIASVAVVRPPDDDEQPVPYVRIGDVLVIRGSSFYPGTRVLLGEVDATAGISADSTNTILEVTIPDDPDLRAGVQRLQLVRDVEVGGNDVPLMRSGVSAIVVIPTLSGLSAASGSAGTTLTMDGGRLVSEDGPTLVMLGDRAVAIEDGGTPTQVEIVVPALGAATYPVSIRVNGAESIDAHNFEVT